MQTNEIYIVNKILVLDIGVSSTCVHSLERLRPGFGAGKWVHRSKWKEKF